jgi:hypothetical protein
LCAVTDYQLLLTFCCTWSLQLLMSPRDQLEQQLLVPLIVSLSQHLDWTAYTKHTLQVKEVAEMYDKVSHATQQVRGRLSAARGNREGHMYTAQQHSGVCKWLFVGQLTLPATK